MKRLRAAAVRISLRLNPDLRDQLAVVGSQFFLNLSLFAIVFLASLLLEPAEFVRLSLANTYILALAMVFDFGLNQSTLKLSIENNQPRFVDFNVAVKAGLFFISGITLVLTTAVVGPVPEIVIVTGAAGVAFWISSRVIEQYHRRFLRYAALNLALTASRILFGGLALFTNSGVMIALALHVAAQLPIHGVTLTRLFRQRTALKGTLLWSETRVLRQIAPQMFFNTALYTSIPVITQTAIYLHADTAATAAFGIVLLFLGPLGLIVSTLRIYVLPQVLLTSLSSVDVFGLGRGSFHILVGAFAGVFLLSVVPLSFLLTWVYEARFPQIGPFFLIYFCAQCLTNAVGFYNMRSLREDFIRIALATSALRVAFIAPVLVLPDADALAIVIWSSLVLLSGEFLCAWLLTIAHRRRQKGRRTSECP